MIGTILNYFLDDKINKAKILFPGVGCFFIAVCLGFIVHSSNIVDNQAKLKDFASEGNNIFLHYVIVIFEKTLVFFISFYINR